MTAKIHSYDSDGITVQYDAKRCIHAAECVHGLPGVFDPASRPWVDARAAPPQEIAQVIQRCPTGALTYLRKDGGGAEPAPATNTLTVNPDGPLYLHGALTLTDSQNSAVQPLLRAALCRCGASQNKPFCDGTHNATDFQDAGRLGQAKKMGAAAADTDRTLRIQPLADGPLALTGPLTLKGSDGGEVTASEVYLCRCGESQNKPFCDGSHRARGFSAD